MRHQFEPDTERFLFIAWDPDSPLPPLNKIIVMGFSKAVDLHAAGPPLGTEQPAVVLREASYEEWRAHGKSVNAQAGCHLRVRPQHCKHYFMVHTD